MYWDIGVKPIQQTQGEYEELEGKHCFSYTRYRVYTDTHLYLY